MDISAKRPLTMIFNKTVLDSKLFTIKYSLTVIDYKPNCPWQGLFTVNIINRDCLRLFNSLMPVTA